MTTKTLLTWGSFWTAIASATLLGPAALAQTQQQPEAARPAAGANEADPVAAVAAEKGVDALLAGYTRAINERDVAQVAAFFAGDAVLIDLDGMVTEGQEAIGEQFAAGFAEVSDFTLETTRESLRVLSADVIQMAGRAQLTAPSEASIVTRFSALLVKRDGAWRFAEIRDLPAPPDDVAPFERLRELEWMVGDWIDENPNATIKSTVTWGENRSCLVRNSTAQVMGEPATSSLMVVAWDPRTAQIRSWLFSSEGGLGEAIWTRTADNQWIVKAEGTRRDGSPSSATQIVTLLGSDRVKTSSLDRIIGGQIAPDIEELLMVRQAPAPAETEVGISTSGR